MIIRGRQARSSVGLLFLALLASELRTGTESVPAEPALAVGQSVMQPR